MSTTAIAPAEDVISKSVRIAPAGISTRRLAAVELRKMFNTRSGFWLMASIGILAVLATAAVILFAGEAQQTYDNFGAAIGVPMVVILPIIAMMSVTSEWSQRSGLTTFTLVPNRGRVIGVKMAISVAIGVVAIAVALAIGAVGNLIGAAIAGIDPVWDISLDQMLNIMFANVLGLLVGFMLGVLIRNSAAAIVGYFVYSFVLPPLSMVLAASQQWWKDLQPWADFNYTQTFLFDGGMTGEQWQQLGVTAFFWLAVPLMIGLWLVRRAEVK